MGRAKALAIARALALAATAATISLLFDKADAQGKPPAPLSTEDASARPWRRYPGWPTRDAAGFNSLTRLAKRAAQAVPPRHRRSSRRRKAGR